MRPKISVLMPVFGGERYVAQTLETLLQQKFGDFEVIAVIDASPDKSREIVASYKDPRIRMIENEHNLGQTASQQIALGHACGEYIARQDQDDISLPDRFLRQVEFLDANRDIGVLGTNYCVIDDQGRVIEGSTGLYPPETVCEMAWRLIWTDRLVDSSVMLRTESARRVGGFDVKYRYAQDFDLWMRLSFETGVARLSEVLLELRVHPGSASNQFRDDQENEVDKIVQNAVSRVLGRAIDLEAAAIARQVQSGHTPRTRKDIWEAVQLIRTVFDRFSQNRALQGSELESVKRTIAETFLKTAVKYRSTLGTETLWLLASALKCYPGMFVHPSTILDWWARGQKAYRHREVIKTLYKM